jgi:hypothetical protein
VLGYVEPLVGEAVLVGSLGLSRLVLRLVLPGRYPPLVPLVALDVP